MILKREVDLYRFLIHIPMAYADGVPTAYIYRSIGDILDSEDPLDLMELETWFTNHVLRFLGWPRDKTPTTEQVMHALQVLIDQGIDPSDCLYMKGDPYNERTVDEDHEPL